MKENKQLKTNKRDEVLDKTKRVIALIADGMSYRTAREQVGISNDGFFTCIRSNDELSEQYARARECLGEASIDFIDEIEYKLLAGEIDATTARVLIDTEKWKASKFYPRIYGDKQQVDMTVQSFDLFAKLVEERAKNYEIKNPGT